MVSTRRVGNETSKTRGVLLDGAERLMLEEGYAAVTYRRVAAEAGVTGGLVQYYFPTLDDLFVCLLRRHADSNLERLQAELETRKDEPLRVVWEFSSNETTAAMAVEFMALANHHKPIRAEIARVGERARQAQIRALAEASERYNYSDHGLSPTAVQFILAGLPKIVLLQEAMEESEGHAEIIALVEGFLDRLEPQPQRRKPAKAAAKAKVNPRRAATRTKPRNLG
jgi:AcrR family transcriptional regulator